MVPLPFIGLSFRHGAVIRADANVLSVLIDHNGIIDRHFGELRFRCGLVLISPLLRRGEPLNTPEQGQNRQCDQRMPHRILHDHCGA